MQLRVLLGAPAPPQWNKEHVGADEAHNEVELDAEGATAERCAEGEE